MTTKIHCVAHVPPELRKAWLQHLRDFDIAHPGCHFDVSVFVPEATVAEMIEETRLSPDLPVKHVIPLKEGPRPATYTTTVVGVGPYCVEFADGEIITTRSAARQDAIASLVR